MKPQLTPKGRKVLNLALARMKRRPESFDMSVWMKKTRCGTVACLAGQIVLAAGVEPNYVGDQAPEVLGVPKDQQWDTRVKLFYEDEWPEPFLARFRETGNTEERVAVAIARVRHWLRTGE